MIAFDTNALVRMLVEDDANQAKIVRDIVTLVEGQEGRILILSEVLMETVWVLESVYHCEREEIHRFLETLLQTPTFTSDDHAAIGPAVSQYRRGGDFADLVIVSRAKCLQAKRMISFDKKLQKKFPDYIFASL